MRLTCPACGAQYAPPEGAIPEGGRIVRCSACRAEWRATPEGDAAAPAPRAASEPSAPLPAPRTPEVREPVAPETAMAGSLEAEAEAEGGGGAGFMAGFAAVALVALAALGLYLNHEAAANAAPALAEPIAAFVGAVDALRLELARLLGSA